MKTLFTATIALVLTLSVTPAIAQVEGEESQQLPRSEGYIGVAPVTLVVNCGAVPRLATTNRVATTIRNPTNTGACAWTLQCRLGGTVVGIARDLSPNGSDHSFSCGTNADRIIWVTTGTAGEARIQFVP